jgi:hypothetical protein
LSWEERVAVVLPTIRKGCPAFCNPLKRAEERESVTC